MTPFERGDVVLVEFPFTSGVASKRRPAVIVSSSDYSHSSPDLIILSVTSHLAAVAHPGDHVLQDWNEAGLLKPSLVQTKVATVERSLIVRRLGKLSSRDQEAVDAGIEIAVGLHQ
jgi:mRNA interferase MazF